MNKRLDKWETKYVDFVHSKRNQSFTFGQHDCCITACDMIQAITGVDPAVDFRTNYGIDNPMRALKLVKEYGDVDGIAEVVCDEYGWPEVQPNFARRCDLVCIDLGGDRKALGWIDLDGKTIMAPGMVGLQELSRSKALRAWSIG